MRDYCRTPDPNIREAFRAADQGAIISQTARAQRLRWGMKEGLCA
jgi:hypothetical protein